MLKNEQIPVIIIKDTIINYDKALDADILHYQPKTYELMVFKNNIINANNKNHHIVLFGNEVSSASNRMLDGLIITGNKIVWKGTNILDSNEGILVGYSINALIKYNYIQNSPYGTPLKSSGYTNDSGGIAYNVYCGSFKVGAGAKGINGSKFYNNTFYNNCISGEGVIGSIYINSNNDVSASESSLSSKNCRIYNNIFYTRHQVPNIYCDGPSLQGLQCDYNVYYCEDGEPVFRIAGETISFTKWQGMGYDKHSKIINPQFKDTQTLIPTIPLPYGINLGIGWKMGLAPTAQWGGGDPILKSQEAIWYVGAYIY